MSVKAAGFCWLIEVDYPERLPELEAFMIYAGE